MRLPRRSLLGLVLLAVAAVLPGSAQAGDEGILLKGSISSYVDVTIYETIEMRVSDIEITSAGRFAGFYLLPNFNTRKPVGAFWSPRVGATTGSGVMPLGEGWTLTAGAYRLYLFAEAPTEVFIPLPGSAFRAYQPRARASVSLRQMDFLVGPNDAGVEKRITVGASSRRTLVAAVSYATSTSVTGMDQSSTCLASFAQSCSSQLPATRASIGAARSYQADVRPIGRYDAVFRLTRGIGVHGDTLVRTSVLVLNS